MTSANETLHTLQDIWSAISVENQGMQDDIAEIKNHLAELKGEFVASKNSLTRKVNTLTEELASTNESADGHGDHIAQLKGEVHCNEQARAFVGDQVTVLEGDWTVSTQFLWFQISTFDKSLDSHNHSFPW